MTRNTLTPTLSHSQVRALLAIGIASLLASSIPSALGLAQAQDPPAAEAGHDEPHADHDEPHADGDEPHADHDEPHADGDEEEHEDDEDLVRLSPAEIAEFGILVAPAGPGRIENSLELPGEVRPNDDRLAHIVPRYSGIVTDVLARIGDYVERGQVLAVIESDETLAPFEVRTLISGTVIGKHITLGEAASRERDAFVIADLSTVWVDLTVYQRDIDRIEVGQEVTLFRGHEPTPDAGRIAYVTPIVDEHTRTATARVVLPNKERSWRPGMFVTALVKVEETEVPLVVPKTALHRLGNQQVVFVEAPEGFRAQAVQLGRAGQSRIEVLSGLTPGDRIASEGGFTLKAELEKDSFAHSGHAH
jgi:cobalt-zinc-cadmium efflux system membrane fusion protein